MNGKVNFVKLYTEQLSDVLSALPEDKFYEKLAHLRFSP